MHSLTSSEHLRAAPKRSSSELSSPISMSRKKTLWSPGVVSSTPNSSKRNTSLMKTLFLCQLMSPLLLTRRIGHDAEAKTDKNQQEYVVLSIATKDSWKNDQGDYVAPRLRMAQSFTLREESTEGPAHQRRWPDSLSRLHRRPQRNGSQASCCRDPRQQDPATHQGWWTSST
jgi:hypothetical protein